SLFGPLSDTPGAAAARAGTGGAALLPRGRTGDLELYRRPVRLLLAAARRPAGVRLSARRAAPGANQRRLDHRAALRARAPGAAPRERAALRCPAGPARRRGARAAGARLGDLP